LFDQTSDALEQRIATGLHKIGLALRHQTWLAASAHGLSPTQGQILAALATDGPLTGSELGERLGVTLPTISDSAHALVEKGLVSKRPDERHPRASLLELTRAGRKRAMSVRSWPEFLAVAVGTLPATEKQAFLAALVKMIRALQEKGQIPLSRMCLTCVYFRPRAHDGPLPHHCAFVDAPMADQHLRLDCGEQEEAPSTQREEAWARFMSR
jgi:DNA-binding MarR family transcriptional regulator